MIVYFSFHCFQIRKKNSLKDCVAVAGPLGVTHFLIVSKTETNVYFVSGCFHSPHPPPLPALMMTLVPLSCHDSGFKVNALKR